MNRRMLIIVDDGNQQINYIFGVKTTIQDIFDIINEDLTSDLSNDMIKHIGFYTDTSAKKLSKQINAVIREL